MGNYGVEKYNWNEKFMRGTNRFGRISEVEVRLIETANWKAENKQKQERKKEKWTELQRTEMRSTIIPTYTQWGAPEGEKRYRKEQKVMSKKKWGGAENIPNLMKTNLCISETQWIICRINTKRCSKRHITIKILKYKGKKNILKAAREKGLFIDKWIPLRPKSDFSGTMEERRPWNDIFGVLKERNCQPSILPPAKLSLINEGQIQTAPDKNWENLLLTDHLLKITKGILQAKGTGLLTIIWTFEKKQWALGMVIM